MTAVELRPITRENFFPVTRLKVAEDQQTFVATNVMSLAQAWLYPDWHPQAIYTGEELVGFVMWGFDPQDEPREYWVIRLMVDVQFQGRGYGTAALEIAIEQIRAAGAEAVFISFEPENVRAEAIYRRLGFEDTGRVESGEVVYRKALT